MGCLLLVLAGCAAHDEPATEQQTAPAIEDVTVDAAAEMLGGENVVVLDIRTPGEFERDRLPGAILVDYKSEDFETKLAELDRGKTYVMY